MAGVNKTNQLGLGDVNIELPDRHRLLAVRIGQARDMSPVTGAPDVQHLTNVTALPATSLMSQHCL